MEGPPGIVDGEHDIKVETYGRLFSLTLYTNPHYTHDYRGVAQFGSAPRLGRGGRRFESARPD
jgi:hypothetical protein